MSTFQKIYKIVILLLFLIVSLLASAQNQPTENQSAFLLKTYPIRYIYGVNGEATFLFKNGHQVSGMYQHHDRDFFSIRGRGDVLGFGAIPTLLPANGFTLYLSYEFPIGDELFWWGPKLGGKFIRGRDNDFENSDGEINVARVEQQNGYLLAQISVRNQNKGFIIEGYAHAGIVQIEKDEIFLNPDGSLDYDPDPQSLWLPHILVGFSIGFGI